MYRYCLAYCYADILMAELSDFQNEWNSHYMRRTHGARCPAGVPDDLFYLPEMTGCILLEISIIIYDYDDHNICIFSDAENRLYHDVDGELWLTAWYEYATPTPVFYPSDFKEVVDEYLFDTFALYHPVA